MQICMRRDVYAMSCRMNNGVGVSDTGVRKHISSHCSISIFQGLNDELTSESEVEMHFTSQLPGSNCQIQILPSGEKATLLTV